jgi:hypothetical protein
MIEPSGVVGVIVEDISENGDTKVEDAMQYNAI